MSSVSRSAPSNTVRVVAASADQRRAADDHCGEAREEIRIADREVAGAAEPGEQHARHRSCHGADREGEHPRAGRSGPEQPMLRLDWSRRHISAVPHRQVQVSRRPAPRSRPARTTTGGMLIPNVPATGELTRRLSSSRERRRRRCCSSRPARPPAPPTRCPESLNERLHVVMTADEAHASALYGAGDGHQQRQRGNERPAPPRPRAGRR